MKATIAFVKLQSNNLHPGGCVCLKGTKLLYQMNAGTASSAITSQPRRYQKAPPKVSDSRCPSANPLENIPKGFQAWRPNDLARAGFRTEPKS